MRKPDKRVRRKHPWGRVAFWGANSKEEIMGVVADLHAYGLGSRIISELTGYSERQCHVYIRDAGCGKHNPRTIADAIVARLPDDLVQRVDALRLKHTTAVNMAKAVIAHAQAQLPSRTVHRMVDDDGDSAVNIDQRITSGAMPKIPSLADLLST